MNYKEKLTIQFFQQLLQIVFPFLIISLLITRVNFVNYSNLVYYQSIFNIVVFLVNYGTEIPLTKELIKYNEGNITSNKIISNIIVNNFINFFIILIISIVISYLFKEKMIDPLIIIYYALGLLVEVFSPIIFLQVLNFRYFFFILFILSKLLLLLLLFNLTKFNYFLFPFYKFISDLFLLFFSFLIIKKRFKFIFTSIYDILISYRIYFSFFISRILSVFSSNILKIISGLFFTIEIVGILDILDKINIVTKFPSGIINNVFFINKTYKINKFKILVLNFITTIFFVVIIFFYLTNYYHINELELNIFYYYLPVFIFTNINSSYGLFYLVDVEKYKIFNYSVIITTILLTLIYSTLIFFNVFNFFIYLFIFVFSELIILLTRIYFNAVIK